MPSYALFGGTLDSELDFSGLEAGGPSPLTWHLCISETAVPPRESTRLGSAEVDAGVLVHVARLSDGYRLEYDDTGTFDIVSDGARITWYPRAGADKDAARLDVLGRVMAVALHAAGDFCLHASAALTPNGVVGFLAPKFHGKSTLAMAMAHAGCRILTDDILPIGLAGSDIVARPGVPQIRLWRDSARHLARDRVEGHIGGKHTIPDLAPFSGTTPTFSLAALYLICPRSGAANDQIVDRTSLPPVQGALTLVGHAKVGEILGGLEAPTLLHRAAAIVSSVPTYRLELVRGYDHIAQVATRILGWHSKRPTHLAASA